MQAVTHCLRNGYEHVLVVVIRGVEDEAIRMARIVEVEIPPRIDVFVKMDNGT